MDVREAADLIRDIIDAIRRRDALEVLRRTRDVFDLDSEIFGDVKLTATAEDADGRRSVLMAIDGWERLESSGSLLSAAPEMHPSSGAPAALAAAPTQPVDKSGLSPEQWGRIVQAAGIALSILKKFLL